MVNREVVNGQWSMAPAQGWVMVFTGVGNVVQQGWWCLKGNNAVQGWCLLLGQQWWQCPAWLYFSLLVKYGDVTDSGGEEEE